MNPPGTASLRPGSGMKRPPGTANRLSTASMGRGTEAAVGVSLNANINVSDRPVTGQGMMGMKAQTQSQGRVIQDSSYYVGVIRNRIKDINNESLRLKSEYDQLNKDRTQLSQLERKYESLSKSKETLEGQLADYNLALDKTRTSTDPEDVEDMASRLSQKNRQTGQELDRILAARKQREAETANIDGQIEAYYRSIQARINDLEPGKLRAYNDLLARQREMQERASGSEARLNEINSRIRQYESDDKANAVRKQYMTLEKTYQGLKRDLEAIQEELEIANLDPKEAHTKFVARVNDFKNAAKEMESRAASIKSEIESAKKLLEDLNNNVEEDSGEAAKFELLQKRDQDMTAFMDKFESTKSAVLQDTENAQATVVALLEHMSRGIEDVANLPDQEMKGELDDVKSLKEKNLRTAERTMESLQVEERKRRKELDLLLQSEPKLKTELAGLKADMRRMSEEIEVFKDVNGMRREFEKTQQYLQEQKRVYVKRRDSMRQQVQALSVEHEGAKKALASHDIARELDDTEKRLKHYERAIFEIKEFVESKARESDFELIKSDCLKKLDLLNSLVVKASQEGPGRAMYLK
jgi:intraflagellar transport protein 74